VTLTILFSAILRSQTSLNAQVLYITSSPEPDDDADDDEEEPVELGS
jgi:hypothetical protein